MRRKLRPSTVGRLVTIVLLLSCTFSRLSAHWVPWSSIPPYTPDEAYEHEIELENRRHDLALLKFRDQTRAAEAKFSKAMLDCANTPPQDDCAKKAAATEMSAMKAIQKREIDENTRHLGNLDKIATNSALGKRR
jgi:hypothetical protein